MNPKRLMSQATTMGMMTKGIQTSFARAAVMINKIRTPSPRNTPASPTNPEISFNSRSCTALSFRRYLNDITLIPDCPLVVRPDGGGISEFLGQPPAPCKFHTPSDKLG